MIQMKIHTILSALLLSISTLAADEKPKPVPIFNGNDLTGWSVKSQEAEKAKAEGYWTIVDGVIQVDTKGDKKHGYVWLCYDQDLADFELTLKVRSPRFTKGNSGIQIRSRYLPKQDGKNGYWLSGPQIDIHPLDPFRIGLIYDETAGVNRWIHPSKKSWNISWIDSDHKWLWRSPNENGEYLTTSNIKAEIISADLTKQETDLGWNTIKIRAVGHKIQTWVNGLPVADYDGAKDLTTAMHQKLNVGTTGKIFLQLHARDDLAMQFKDIHLLKLSAKEDKKVE